MFRAKIRPSLGAHFDCTYSFWLNEPILLPVGDNVEKELISSFSNLHGVEMLECIIKKNNFIRNISSRQNNTNKLYGRKLESIMRIRLILLRRFVNDGIHNIQFAEYVANLFCTHCLVQDT